MVLSFDEPVHMRIQGQTASLRRVDGAGYRDQVPQLVVADEGPGDEVVQRKVTRVDQLSRVDAPLRGLCHYQLPEARLARQGRALQRWGDLLDDRGRVGVTVLQVADPVVFYPAIDDGGMPNKIVAPGGVDIYGVAVFRKPIDGRRCTRVAGVGEITNVSVLLTVLEALQLGGEKRRQQPVRHEAQQAVGLDHLVLVGNRLPETSVGVRVGQCSLVQAESEPVKYSAGLVLKSE